MATRVLRAVRLERSGNARGFPSVVTLPAAAARSARRLAGIALIVPGRACDALALPRLGLIRAGGTKRARSTTSVGLRLARWACFAQGPVEH